MQSNSQKDFVLFAISFVLLVTLSTVCRRASTLITHIEISSSFPADELEGKGIFLNGALYIDSDRRGNVFISNTKEANILCFDAAGGYLGSLGHKGQGPGELSYITNIIATEDSIIVQDIGNKKVQFFRRDGKPVYSFPILKTYTNMVFDESRGLIYCSPMLSSPGDKLVDVLGERGELIRSFGKPMEFANKWSTLNSVNLALKSDGELFVAFSFFPIVRKYSQEGKLLLEKRINYGGLREKEKANLKNYQDSLDQQTNPSFYFVINAMRLLNKNVFLMSLYPNKTIFELDSSLSIRNIYIDDKKNDYFARDFVVRKAGRGLEFCVLQIIPDNSVDVFGQK